MRRDLASMSVKFEKETMKQKSSAPSVLGSGKQHRHHHGVAHELGERLTGGETAKGYLAVWHHRVNEIIGHD